MGKLKTGLFTHIPLCIMIAICSNGNFFPTQRCYIRIDVEVVLTDLKEVFTTTNNIIKIANSPKIINV